MGNERSINRWHALLRGNRIHRVVFAIGIPFTLSAVLIAASSRTLNVPTHDASAQIGRTETDKTPDIDGGSRAGSSYVVPTIVGTSQVNSALPAASPSRRAETNVPEGITGLAQTGCGQCHVPKSNFVVPTFSGPTTLGATLTGDFSITTQYTTECGLIDNPCRVGIDVASSNAQGLATNDTGIQLSNNEIIHTQSAKTIPQNQMGTVAYNFKYTMPNVAPGTVRTLYGVSRVGSGGWNKATNFDLAVPLGSSQPTSQSLAFTPSTYSMTVTWYGSGTAAAFRVAVKPSPDCPTLPTQSIVDVPVTSNHSVVVNGLNASTNYCFSVWGSSETPVGGNSKQYVYSAGYASGTATTSAVPPPVVFPLLITGRLGTARFNHTATLLPTGKVLISGGHDGTNSLQSAELYDPVTGTFSFTGSMSVARSGHTATSLPNGQVLITGGNAANALAELYDPYSGTFSSTGTMSAARTGHTATLLQNGRVLVAGGTTSVSAADLYNPSTGTFTPTGNLTTARFDHTATLLNNGNVLLAGGSATAGGTALAIAEVYDAGGNTFSGTTNNLTNARKGHTATAGPADPNGLVYLVGGFDTAGNPLLSREIYRTTDNSFVGNDTLYYATAKHTSVYLPSGVLMIAGGVASNGTSLDTVKGIGDSVTLTEPRQSHTATLLANGRVLIAGGRASATGNAIGSAEFYDPSIYLNAYPRVVLGQLQQTGNMTSGRNAHTGTLLPNGKVLVAGGYSQNSNPIPGCFVYEWNTAELYDPDSGMFTATTGNMNSYRAEHTATLLPNGKVLIAGGYWDCSTNALNTADLYDPTADTFTATGNLTTARWQHTATLLANGKVLIAGGNTGNTTASAELYDPNTGTFSATGNMVYARRYHTATLLPSGKVLIAGGRDNITGTLDTSELYDPTTGTFAAVNIAVYSVAREQHTATLLPTGNVLVANGATNGSSLFSSLLYDSAVNDYGLSSCCRPHNNGGRIGGTATLLPDGRVVFIGGGNENGKVEAVEIWDPSYSSLLASGNMVRKRSLHTATLLPSGEILVTGGVGVTLSDGTDSTAERFKLGGISLGVTLPVIATAPTILDLPAGMTLTGTGFRYDSEAHSGNTQSSSSDLPILRLQRVDNEQISFIRPSTRAATSFSSTIQSGLPDGHYRATIITDGVPSAQKLVALRTVPLVAPGSFSATATSTTSISVLWGAVTGAASYEVLRTEDNVNYTSRGTVSVPNLADSAQSGKSYLYKVRALDALGSIGPDSSRDLATTVIFTDEPIVAGTTPARALHITQLRTAVNAVRALGGLPGGTFAETITAGSTTIKASHILELRSALNPARTALGLSGVSYADPSLAGGFLIKAAHVADLRSGVK